MADDDFGSLFGVRRDIDLRRYWWHRFAQVVWTLILIGAALAVDGELSARKAGVQEWLTAGGYFFLVNVIALNLYYRGFVYIVCGPRHEEHVKADQQGIESDEPEPLYAPDTPLPAIPESRKKVWRQWSRARTEQKKRLEKQTTNRGHRDTPPDPV